MDGFERNIQLSWRHRVLFVPQVFRLDNNALRDVLMEQRGGIPTKALVVLDEGLAQSRPELSIEIEAWFGAHREAATLVAPPLILPGGEEVKNRPELGWDLLAMIEKFHIDRHSYVIAVGGGALLDVVGFVAAVAAAISVCRRLLSAKPIPA